ncbi:MAG: helix-turn-helix domain-containing protein [Anaerolineae bacterium]|nr:helix-turn-helix domain-containing protein [Anaerolineae bacterium]
MNDTPEWLSLQQAAQLLGVHPATVRIWADEGKIPSRRTPGKHRRFRKSDLMQYAESQGELQPLEVQVILQNALGQMRMTMGESTLTREPWYAQMGEGSRAEMRSQGRLVLERLRQYLASGGQDSQLAPAIKLGEEYARQLSGDGLTLPQATRGYFYFGDFVVNAILTWSELTPHSPSEWAQLLRQVNTFMNAMLLSIIEYYQED